MCIGGPSSMLAFDFAREHNPPARLSTATGIVNSAGFLLSVLAPLAIGVVLTVVDRAATYALPAFRVAELTQVPVWGVGLIMVWRSSRALRRLGRPDDVGAPADTDAAGVPV